MGAGIAAVAGVDNEPSSQRTDVEEAQAELRQELAGRNERRRELDFLEKGGDPLEFKFGDSLPGLWSLSPTDPLVKHLPSDGRGSLSDKNHIKEEKADYDPEVGSESKRARGISGKFCVQDHSATSISIEKALPETLPTSISSSLELDRKDPPKKELDACKSNKVAVKGQYARRNRQRSNRFSNGLTASRDLGRGGAEGGFSTALTVKDQAACDTESNDGPKEISTQAATTDQVALQSGSADAKACVRVEQDKVSAALDLPVSTTIVQASSPNGISERAKDLQASEPLLSVTTQEPEGIASVEQDEGPQSMDTLPSSDVEEGRDMPSAVSCMGAEEKNPLLPVPCDSQAKDSMPMESTIGLFSSSMDENRAMSDDIRKSSLEAEILRHNRKDIPEEVVAGSKKAILAEGKIDQTPSADKQTTIDVVASESKQRLDTETSVAVIESINPAPQLASDSSILEEKAQDNKVIDKEINNTGLCGKGQSLGEVTVKVEHETSDTVGSLSVSRANLSPVNVMNSHEEAPLQLQYSADGSTNPGSAVAEGLQVQASLSEANAVPADTLPVAVPQEKTNISEAEKDVRNSRSPPPKTADKNTAAQESEEIKQDSLKDNVDGAKQRSLQEPPRRKTHWDFVLEEMAWLANDFMQERLWKLAAAAQVATWVMKEKQQLEFEEAEVRSRQCKIAQSLARAIKKFWSSVEANLLKGAAGTDSTSADKAQTGEAGIETVEPIKKGTKEAPIQAYASRFLKDFSGRQLMPQAEAPPTPDRASESGIFDFWEGHLPEESLFYTVPLNAMEVYRQSVVSQWEGEYEQRLQEQEAAMAEMDVQGAGEAMDYSSGAYAVGPLVSPLVTGKRSSGVLGTNTTNRGSIPTKRMRTSAVAARQRAAGGTGPLVSIPLSHLARSDISSCDTNSQQDEMTGLLEGSSVSGRATDVDSNGAFVRNRLAVDGVDSPFKSKKKKKTRHFSGGHVASVDRDSEQIWEYNNHRQREQKEHSKQRAEQAGIGNSGLEGHGTTTGAYHGPASVTSSANKLIKQITSRDRSRKYKSGKASSIQPGFGIPWSPIEDQAILGLVYELGLNWELVSDILSSNSQLKGIFRKPKDCKERYKMLTDRQGGDGGDSPDDPSSGHLSISLTHKGGTRFLPQHLEETLKSHVECILQLHQQLHSRKLQSESQEPKQLVPEHESHGIKHTAMTPLELCELSSTSSDLGPSSYPLQPAHGNGLGIPNMLSPGVGMRPSSSSLQGANNLQMSPSISPSASINAAATRDAQRLGVSMRPLAAEEQRLRYSRMVAGRGIQNPGLSVTPGGSPLMSLPNAADCTASQSLPSANSAGIMCGLNRGGMPATRTGLPGLGPVGVPNISAGMNNASPSVGMGLSGPVNAGAVTSPGSMMRRPREAISMGHSPSAALNNANASLPSPVVSSPTQSFSAQQQQQLLQHNSLQPQQQSPSSSQQQQAYNMMRVAKERQQMQQQQQKRMLQQQQSPTSNTLPSPFQSAQPLPAAQQQHGLSPHAHMFPQQHQPSHLLMQQHNLQEPGAQQQHAPPPSALPQLAVSPPGQPSLSSNSQNSQPQQSLSQAHQPTPTTSPTQPPFPSKHHSLSVKQQHQQQQQQQQGKNMKAMGRGEGQPTMLPSQVSSQLAGQQMPQNQRMGDPQGTLPQQLAGGPSPQTIPANMSQVADVGVQQFQQKGFPQHLPMKHMSQQVTPMSNCPSVQPTSPPTGTSAPLQQQSPGSAASLPTMQQQRRMGQQPQSQQRRPQQSQAGMSLSPQAVSQQPGKTVLQPSSLPVGFQLGSNTNNPLSMASPSGVPLSSPNNSGSGGFSSPQWKPGQNFTPMAAGLYNLSRSNSGIAAQAPHLAMSVGMHLPLSNGKIPVPGNSLVPQEISRGNAPHITGHVGAVSQKVSAGSVNSRAVPVVQQHMAPSPRQLTPQQQLNCTSSNTGGQQLRPASSGSAPAPE